MRLRRRGGEDGGGGGEDRGWVSAAGGGGGDGSGGEWWPPLETNGRWSRGSRGLALSCLTVKTAAIHPSKSKTVVTQTLVFILQGADLSKHDCIYQRPTESQSGPSDSVAMLFAKLVLHLSR